MELGRKLALLTGAAPPAAASLQARLACLRARLEALEHAPRDRQVVPDLPPPPPALHGLAAARRETPFGELYCLEHRFAATHRHGEAPLAAAADADPAALAELCADPAVGAVDPRGLLYLDTETTGLWGGSGTLPFLIGLGWFHERAFFVEQLLLARPGHEEPMLRRLAERLATASGVVTYNGKAFDWPLLRNRFILNRVPLPPAPCHLDLLGAARRLFCYRLSAFNLTTIEEQILAKKRDGDVDGGEIPALYWRFVRTGDSRLLAPVLSHNLDDVVALAALVGRLGAPRAVPPDATEWLARARLAFRRRDLAAALTLARRATAGPLPARGWAFVGRLARRCGAASEAAAAWQAALEAGTLTPRAAAEAHLALAKLYEHQLGDLERATAHARATLRAEGPVAQARRLARLARRRTVVVRR